MEVDRQYTDTHGASIEQVDRLTERHRRSSLGLKE
jgi:hypothetical protein